VAWVGGVLVGAVDEHWQVAGDLRAVERRLADVEGAVTDRTTYGARFLHWSGIEGPKLVIRAELDDGVAPGTTSVHLSGRLSFVHLSELLMALTWLGLCIGAGVLARQAEDSPPLALWLVGAGLLWALGYQVGRIRRARHMLRVLTDRIRTAAAGP